MNCTHTIGIFKYVINCKTSMAVLKRGHVWFDHASNVVAGLIMLTT